MDITNQLIESFGKFDSTLNALDQRLVALGESVDKFSDSTKKATDDEESKQKKLTDYEKKRLQFEKKYDKEIKNIQKRFATAITVATKTQAKLNQLNQKYNKGLQTSIKNTLMQNKVTGNLIKGVSIFKDAMGVAAAKLKEMPGFGTASRGMGTAGRAAGSLLGKMGKVLPMASILAVPALIVRQLMKVDQTMADIATSTGLVGGNLAMVQDNVERASSGLYAFGINMGDAGRQAGALVDSLGNASLVTADLIENTSKIAKATGMSAQEAAELSRVLVRGFGQTADDVESFTNNMMSFATTSGVNARKVMRDISSDSNLTSIYLGRGEDYLMRSAVLAAKMGKSLAEQNTTLDAFSTIESSVENVAEINRLTGANLDSQKMFMMFQTQDSLGVMKELQKAFSNPRAIAMIDRYPGAFKNVASTLNLSVTELKNLDKVMKDFEKSTSKADKQQEMIEQSINDSTTILETLKNLLLQAILPAFNNIGKFLVDTINPSIDGAVGKAAEFGKQIQDAMAAEDTFSGKVIAAFTTIIDKAKPLISKLFDEIMVYLEPTIKKMMDFIGNEFMIMVGEATRGYFGKTRDDATREQATALGIDVYSEPPRSRGTARKRKSMEQLQAEIQEAGENASAMGNVIRRPTMALVGEEGRSEVIIPTERIRKGLPVSSSVASELSSIGVPGFARGQTFLSSTQVDTAANTFALRQQQNALLFAQGSNEAIRRVEANIEKQSAEIKKEQRALVNDVMELAIEIEERTQGPRGPSGPTPTGLSDRAEKGGDGFFVRLEKGLHRFATGLDNFMEGTGTTYTDLYNILPENFRETAEATFKKLPDSMEKGLTVGVQTAYDKFLETGKLQDAVRAGAAAGVRKGVEESGPNTKVAGQIVADMLEGQSFKESLGGVLSRAQNDPQSRLIKTLDGLRKSSVITEGMGAKAIGAASKAAGVLGALEGGIAAFQSGGGLKDIGRTAVEGGVGKLAGTAITGALSATPLAPFAPFIGSFLGGKVGGAAGKVFGKIFGGGKSMSSADAQKSIKDIIVGNLIGVTTPGMQLSKNFREGSNAHKVIRANIGFAAAKNPDKLFKSVSDAVYSASGIRYSKDKSQAFIQTLYGEQIKGDARSQELDKYEYEMEGGVQRAGASGAIVSRPTVALIGEAGPEALVPLENAPGASPLNGVGDDNGALLQEIKRMNQMLGAMANRPITLDGQRVNSVLNASNSDDMRAGIYTVNSR